jgi:hypothetical protein
MHIVIMPMHSSFLTGVRGIRRTSGTESNWKSLLLPRPPTAVSNMTGGRPITDGNGLGHYFTANFKFTAVPEPNVALFTAMAAIPLLRRR